jgi:group I intron endonuclease
MEIKMQDRVYKVYLIINSHNEKVYVGQTYQDLKQRWKQHIRYSGFCKEKIYRAMRKYGVEKFEILLKFEVSTVEEADFKERELIKHYNSIKNGYNTQDGGRKGFKMTQRIKDIISKANKGKVRSELTRQRMSLANKGKKLSEEHKRKCSESQLGEKSAWWGRKHSIETKNKISQGNKGKVVSVKSIEKMRQSKLGKKASEKTKIKMSLARKGRKPSLGMVHSEEHKKKISIKSKNQLFPIKCIENNKVYVNAARAAEDLNIKKQSIADYFISKTKTASGFTFIKVSKEDYLTNLTSLN